jgi:patatin-related protein
MSCAPARPKSREVRLGLVMFGGVSLAIYIFGVAMELFRAVRGRGVYRIVKAMTDSDVVVDILSGSSAGGINGILLAYALCNECELDPAADLWRLRGDLGDLMRGLDDAPETYTSILDSEGKYEPALLQAFESLRKKPIADSTKAKEDASPVRELDLFVTGTDFFGRRSVTTDDRGQKIDVKDHRTLFWLKHRAGRKEPFSPKSDDEDRPAAAEGTSHAALARLARITSCFPGAFTPVVVGAKERVDLRLRYWGDLPMPPPGARAEGTGVPDRVFVDGGVLDNKPFSSTLNAIYTRLADRDVKRWLLYVEPDPERFAPELDPRDVPSVVETALASLTSIPGYESIAEDLRSLRQHNDKVQRIASIRDSLFNGKGADAPRQPAGPAAAPASGWMPEYHRLRVIGLGDHVFASLFTREVERSSLGPRLHDAQRALRAWFTNDVVAKADTRWAYLTRLDVDFRLRRLYHLVYTARQETQARRIINREIEMLEIVRAAMEMAVERVADQVFAPGGGAPVTLDRPWVEGVWAKVRAALDGVVGVDALEWFPSGGVQADGAGADVLLSDARTAEFSRAMLRQERKAANPPLARSLLEQSDAFEQQALAQWSSRQAYDAFEEIDALLYPIELVSRLRGQDVPKIARVSPFDAQTGLSHRPMDQKVLGRLYGHFGAFLKRSWRANDILWGRLDGACELVDVLLDKERMAEHLAVDGGARAALRAAIAATRGDPEALPLPQGQRESLLAWLDKLASDDASVREGALVALSRVDPSDGASGARPLSANDAFDPRALLIEAAQLEALKKELATVVADAAAEQLTWNAYPKGDRALAKVEASAHALQWLPATGPFIPGKGALDPAVIAATTAFVAQSVSTTISASQDKLSSYFNDHYRVGDETLACIPRVVVFEWMARAFVVGRNALLRSLDDRVADRVRDHPAYALVLGRPPRAVAATAAMLRRAPASLVAFVVAAVAYVLVSIAVLVLWWHPVVVDAEGGTSSGSMNTAGVTLFVVLPLACVATVRILVGLPDGPLVWLIRSLKWAAAAAAICISIPIAYGLLNNHTIYECRHSIPFRWMKSVCTDESNLFALGRWMVIAITVLGLLWITGVLGDTERLVRRRR